MALFTLFEIIDMLLMTSIVGYIFSDMFRKPVHHDYDPLTNVGFRGNWNDMLFAMLITAPGILLHELGHKFVALGFGFEATFQAAYMFLILGFFLKLINFPFIFFVPAYVSILGAATPLESSLMAFAGPFVNLVLWLAPLLLVKLKFIKKKNEATWLLVSKINMFLFIFNMLPIPGFDGNKVFMGLIEHFF